MIYIMFWLIALISTILLLIELIRSSSLKMESKDSYSDFRLKENMRFVVLFAVFFGWTSVVLSLLEIDLKTTVGISLVSSLAVVSLSYLLIKYLFPK